MRVKNDGKFKGTAYAVNGSKDNSVEEAMVLYLAFANKLSPHNRIKAEFIRRAFNRAGIRDEKGLTLPVVTVASPSVGSTIKGMNQLDKQAVRKGNFTHATRTSLEIVKQLGFGKVGFVGHSQGGTFANYAAGQAYNQNLDVLMVAASDMTGTKAFKKAELAQAFAADADYLQVEVAQAGLKPYIDALGYDEEMNKLRRFRQDARFVMDVLSHPKLNLGTLLSGLAQPTFINAAKNDAYLFPAAFTYGYGNHSGIVDPIGLEQQVEEARSSVWPTPNMQTIEIDGGRHTWSDNVPLYATFVLDAVQRAKAI